MIRQIEQDAQRHAGSASQDAAKEGDRRSGGIALEFSVDAIRLLDLAHGARSEIGAVSLGAPGLRAGIEALRLEVEARGDPAVDLLLPVEQIVVRQYVLRRGGRDRDEARRRLTADIGRKAEALVIALSPAGDRELVTVLGVPASTVAEAVDCARRWGFRPGRVSARVEAARFGPDGPAFDPPETARARTGWRLPRIAAAAAVLVGIGFGAWSAYDRLATSGDEKIAAAVKGSERSASPEAPRDGSGNQPRTASGRGSAPAPAETRPAIREPQPLLYLAAFGPARIASTAGDPRPSSDGTGSRPPEPDASAARDGTAATDATGPHAGLDGLDADPPSEEPEIQLAAAGDFAPASVPGRPVPKPKAVARMDEAGNAAEAAADASDLAAAHSPRPSARPARPLRVERTTAGKSVARTEIAAPPPQVRNAAAQGGLSLDTTSLIGVIDARNGRQALLRTPSGSYLKVARGDDIAGWRVNAISQDAMRLTRGGESRTLLLVTR